MISCTSYPPCPSENIEGLDSLRLYGSVSVVEPELLKKGVLNNALDALNGQTAGVNVTTNGLDRIADAQLCAGSWYDFHHGRQRPIGHHRWCNLGCSNACYDLSC